MTRIVENMITRHRDACGVWHVSGAPISKHDLLCLVRRHFKLTTRIVPSDSLVCDRSLRSDRFRTTFGYAPPGWDKMVHELAMDNAFYR
jgi:dTDP-4-dehydrorhamnose reductase